LGRLYPHLPGERLMPLSHKPLLSILIVAHNAMDDLPQLFKQLKKHTALPFDVHLWDNASTDGTTEYLRGLYDGEPTGVCVTRSETNDGFIVPNNRLYAQSAKASNAPYVCLLNTDVEVSEGWDTRLHSAFNLITNPGIVGYYGGILNENGQGVGVGAGSEVDYIEGWCYFTKRSVVDALCLTKGWIFDEDAQDFCYAEDSYTSLLAKEKGFTLFGIFPSRQDGTPIIVHKGGQTTNKVAQIEGETRQRLSTSFQKNHAALQHRFADYLQHGRIMASRVKM
jgi:hypothetical protein